MINQTETFELAIDDRTGSPAQLFSQTDCGINRVLAFKGNLEVWVFPHSLRSFCLCFTCLCFLVDLITLEDLHAETGII